MNIKFCFKVGVCLYFLPTLLQFLSGTSYINLFHVNSVSHVCYVLIYIYFQNSDFAFHHEDCRKAFRKKTSSLRKLNDDMEITYASCDQPCPPFVTQETPLLSGNKLPFIVSMLEFLLN